MNTAEPTLELARVEKRFPLGSDRSIEVLRDVNLRVFTGEAVAIIGPSGSGKSTLLGIAGTLEPPDAGIVRIGGVELQGAAAAARARLRRTVTGFVFQQHLLLPHLSALENVLVPLLAGERRVSTEDQQRARRLLDDVGLAQRLDHRPDQLSIGERQRVAIARALIHEPRLLLADEPTGALDGRTAAEITHLLHELRRSRGLTLLVVTHSAALASSVDRVLELADGTLTPRAVP